MVGINLNKIKELIKNRPVLIMVHGKSLENLEQYIYEIGNIDVCYCSLNFFSIIEDNILSNIDKHLNFVYDSSHIDENHVQEFNAKARVPRLTKYLAINSNHIFITNNDTMNQIMFQTGFDEFMIRFQNQIIIPHEIIFDPLLTNSLFILLQICIICGASKIILCGLDGYKEGVKNIDTYYKQILQLQDKKLAGTEKTEHFKSETDAFQTNIKKVLVNLSLGIGKKLPIIYNCSPNSIYTVFPKIDYKQLKGVLLK